jgi:predicted nucleic acid-binding protein
MIAVDANILAYLCLPGEFAQLANAAYEKDPHWIAPLLWQSEFRSILAAYLRRNLIDLKTAHRSMDYMLDLMRQTEFGVISSHVLELVVSSKCSSYDCEYVALAQQYEVTLVTMDKQILQQFPQVAVKLDAFVAS